MLVPATLAKRWELLGVKFERLCRLVIFILAVFRKQGIDVLQKCQLIEGWCLARYDVLLLDDRLDEAFAEFFADLDSFWDFLLDSFRDVKEGSGIER